MKIFKKVVLFIFFTVLVVGVALFAIRRSNGNVGDIGESKTIIAMEMSDKELIESLQPNSDFVIYLLWYSLPVSYAAMHMQLHDTPSYVWASRPDHFDLNHLPDHVTWIDSGDHPYNITYGNSETQGILQELFFNNPDATYTVYVTDMHAYLDLHYMIVERGLNINQLRIEILPDGLLNEYRRHYVNYGYSWKRVLRSIFNISEYKALQQFNIHANLTRKGLVEQENVRELVGTGGPLGYAVSNILHVRYWTNLDTTILPYESIKNQIYFFELPLHRLYSILSTEQQRQFELLMKFDREKFDEVFYPIGELKKPLIIIGTAILDKDGNMLISQNFEKEMRKLIQIFGNEYRIFYKGHPKLPYGNEQERVLMTELGFYDFPNVSFPFELLLLAYPDLVVGGYSSTVFVSVKEEHLLFFMGDVHPDHRIIEELHDRGRWPNAIRINP